MFQRRICFWKLLILLYNLIYLLLVLLYFRAEFFCFGSLSHELFLVNCNNRYLFLWFVEFIWKFSVFLVVLLELRRNVMAVDFLRWVFAFCLNLVTIMGYFLQKMFFFIIQIWVLWFQTIVGFWNVLILFL